MSGIISLDLHASFQNIAQTVHPVLVQSPGSLVLVDCGFIGSLDALEASIRAAGFSPDGITHLLLTHHDHDHMGNAAALKEKYPRIKIAASALEEPYISGKRKSLRLVQAEQMQELLPPGQKAFGKAFCDVLKQVRPVPVDEIAADGALPWCGECRVVSTPGHTPGHLSLYFPSQKTVVVGDAFALEDGQPVIANPQFTLDMDGATASMQTLLTLDADTYLCYHGGVYRK